MSEHERSGRTTLRVATYNIHQGIGRDGHRDLTRVAAVLRELDADLIALQEVAATPAPETPSAQMRELAELGDYHAIAGPTILAHDRIYGNALLTRLPVTELDRIDLSQPGREPRGAIVAHVRAPSGKALVCIATHLGLSGRERRRQTEILAQRIASEQSSPLLLMGDFNGWWPHSSLERIMRQLLGASPRKASFPSGLALMALDRIWARPQGALADLKTLQTPLTRETSDHLPLQAQLHL